MKSGAFLLGGRRGKEKSLTTRQYARLVSNTVAGEASEEQHAKNL
jgi:hypothetical protein